MLFICTCHLRDSARVVGDGAVCVGGEGDAQRGEHADGGDADAEHTHFASAHDKVGAEHRRGNEQDGREGGEHAEGDAVDDDGSRAAL